MRSFTIYKHLMGAQMEGRIATIFHIPVALLICTAPVHSQSALMPSTIHNFEGGPGAGVPKTGVIYANGSFFGSASEGGNFGYGAVFELTPPRTGQTSWSYTIAHSFAGGADGASPWGHLTLDPASGALYGTTFSGGTYGYGTVYQLTPPIKRNPSWAYSVLYSFKGGVDGAHPMAAVARDSNGNLFGTTTEGGNGFGTVFLLTPPPPGEVSGWAEKILHRFAGGSDGANPLGGITISCSDTLYGTTYSGGGANQGVVFRLRPPAAGQSTWSEDVLLAFNGSNGANPGQQELLVGASGELYGATQHGGTGNGTVFRLDPPNLAQGQSTWNLTALMNFSGATGEEPVGGVAFGAKGVLYGTTYLGGTTNTGTVFSLAPPKKGITTWTHTVLYHFDPAGAKNPYGGQLAFDKSGAIVGTTYYGGTSGNGTVFALQ